MPSNLTARSPAAILILGLTVGHFGNHGGAPTDSQVQLMASSPIQVRQSMIPTLLVSMMVLGFVQI